MEKLTLDRFQEIKYSIQEIFNMGESKNYEFTDEEIQDIQSKFDEFNEEIHSHDLSDIAFEEYEDLIDYGIDFSGTNANIDFNIFDLSERTTRLRFKGCNLRNLDLSKFNAMSIDDESFDYEIMEANSEYFLSNDITFLSNDIKDPEVRNRYYNSQITFDDLINWDIKDISTDRLDYNIRGIAEVIGINNLVSIDKEVVELFSDGILGYEFENANLTSLSTQEDVKLVLDNLIVQMLGEGKYKVLFKDSDMSYDDFIHSSYVESNFSEYIIDFPDEKSELKNNFIDCKLELSDIRNNFELFENKKFLERMDMEHKSFFSKSDIDLSEEKLIYFMQNFDNISDLTLQDERILFNLASGVDVSSSQEENKNKIDKYLELEEVIDKKNMGEGAKIIASHPDFFELFESDIKEMIEFYPDKAAEIFSFVERCGVSTLLEFEENNEHFFTRDGCEKIFEIEQKYKNSNIKIPDTEKSFYTQEEFESVIKSVILSKDGEFDYRDLKGTFREKNPEYFLDDEAPEGLKNIFYKENGFWGETKKGFVMEKVFIR